MGIDLKSYVIRPQQPDYRAGDILRRTRLNQEIKDLSQTNGLVTTAVLDITQVSGGNGWAVSPYIEFSYKYKTVPHMSFGLEGTYTGNIGINEPEFVSPYATIGGNDYGIDLPQPIQDFIDAEDYSTWQPAIFVPRIIHLVKDRGVWFVGCYVLVSQVNAQCTETNKELTMYLRFEGSGIRKG